MRATNAVRAGALVLPALVFGWSAGAQTQPVVKPAADPASASGFSIETEMLTYRALESNSEAIGCDIAAWLNGAVADFNNPPKGAVCNAGVSQQQGRVIMLPFDRTLLANFQIWRGDMTTMLRLQEIAEDLRGAAGGCDGNPPPPPPTTTNDIMPRGATASAGAGAFLSMTPAGPPLALAQSVLGLLASDHAATSVSGTIKDLAFMDGVARELRSLKVQVVMPSSYAPGTLGTLDEESSPFLRNRNLTLRDRQCLAQMHANPKVPNKAEIEQTMAQMDAFFASLGENAPAAAKPVAAAAPVTAQAGGASAAAAPVTASVGQAGAGGHLAAVLEADGLAQLLGVNAETGELPDRPKNHVLLVQALESGGTVEKSTNVLGTRYHYSGESVGTYALFSIAGDLECSGNVYDYAGSLKSKDFAKGLQGYRPSPQRQMLFLQSCSGVKAGIQ